MNWKSIRLIPTFVIVDYEWKHIEEKYWTKFQWTFQIGKFPDLETTELGFPFCRNWKSHICAQIEENVKHVMKL